MTSFKWNLSVTKCRFPSSCGNHGNTKPLFLVAMVTVLVWVECSIGCCCSDLLSSLQSLTGNIMTASPISDLNPVLLAVRARLDLASVGKKTSLHCRKEMEDD